MAEDEDFLRRWSRRKAESREPSRLKPQQGPAPTEAAAPPGPGVTLRQADDRTLPAAARDDRAAGEDASAIAEIEATDIETLDYGSDYTKFMRKGVSEVVRRQALRKLWASNPIFGAHDGLDDYYVTADFTDAARATPNVATSYRVGKGYFTDEEIAQREAAEKAEREASARADGDSAGETDLTAESKAPAPADEPRAKTPDRQVAAGKTGDDDSGDDRRRQAAETNEATSSGADGDAPA